MRLLPPVRNRLVDPVQPLDEDALLAALISLETAVKAILVAVRVLKKRHYQTRRRHAA